MPRPGEDFARVLRSAFPRAAVYDYGLLADFAKLWAADDSGRPTVLDDLNDRNAIIVVWEGQQPEDRKSPAGLLQHLTPLDWALTLSIKVLQAAKAEGAQFGISIVDLTGRDDDAWAMRMRHQTLADMPWVALYAPLVPHKGSLPADVRRGYRPIMSYRQGGDEALLVEENGNWRPSERSHDRTLAMGLERRSLDRLVRLAKQWSATLVQEHGHHDLNNLVGPRILMKRPADPDAPLTLAFHRRLDWTQSLPTVRLDGVKLPPAMPFHILAIDDEMNSGWSNVIAAMLGLDTGVQHTSPKIAPIAGLENVTLFGTTDPNALLDQLAVTDVGDAAARYGHRHFDSPMPVAGGDPPVPWMMILDLYLFSREHKAQRAWFEALLGIARNLAAVTEGLAWPGISLDDVETVETWLTGGMKLEEAGFDTAISLLPRLCAVRWPAVPIVIFSSSRRRSLASKLASCRNIFLAAPKPNLLASDPEEEAAAFAAGFRRELERCLALADVQRKLIRLDQASRTSQAATTTLAATPPHRHLTIAFEESGDFKDTNPSAIGGVAIEAFGKDRAAALAETADFLEALRREGVRFYDHPPVYMETDRVGSLLEEPCLRKDTEIAQLVQNAKARHPRCSILAFRVFIPASRTAAAGTAFADAVYFKWLDVTLELVLSEYLDAIDPDRRSSLSVWLPTRVIPCDTEQDAEAQARRFDFRQDRARVSSVGGESVGYTLVAKALAGRDANSFFDRVLALKVRKIPYSSVRSGRYESARHWYCEDCKRIVGRGWNEEPRLNRTTWQEVRYTAGANLNCRQPGHDTKYLIADYTVVAHLADAALTNRPAQFPHAEIGLGNIQLDRSMDVTAGNRLLDFLQVGRLAADGLSVEALKFACKHSFFLGGLNRGGDFRAPVERRLVRVLAAVARSAAGDTFIELAGLGPG